MGIEGDGERAGAEFVGATDDLVNDQLVAAMHAVEVADGGYGGAEVCGNLVE
jgi:hypothetical protein